MLKHGWTACMFRYLIYIHFNDNNWKYCLIPRSKILWIGWTGFIRRFIRVFRKRVSRYNYKSYLRYPIRSKIILINYFAFYLNLDRYHKLILFYTTVIFCFLSTIELSCKSMGRTLICSNVNGMTIREDSVTRWVGSTG